MFQTWGHNLHNAHVTAYMVGCVCLFVWSDPGLSCAWVADLSVQLVTYSNFQTALAIALQSRGATRCTIAQRPRQVAGDATLYKVRCGNA